ncbi:16S rRNA (uracil(1498)-N(3))-methyltransferase [Helicobacter turcicus]|uniref:Ribosomal RNA small subunit methyltransferase E n=1 Tax=Helicobacter turcicus TaxID=2867412 RepID=A0ABS7JMM1_9HELI|nr:16S rRNA (uracil(1498)-N(3))-methyltransferase [Helicobacter turcicus]MBX7490637.1 16S rRNA (uracil(1498)-N(3))-methyltransferase [Helicobacter turcicus]MBX7545455.1 16S rRNA (uracil(1498)-N(3))-methyltransferase [Helicobacter turcicus]
MQFTYHKCAGESTITLDGETYNHLFRSRRTRKLDSLMLCNLEDTNAYVYAIIKLSKKSATLQLKTTYNVESKAPKGHLIWAMIDPKNIEKTLPFLNELNLERITFFYADFSQKHFKLDNKRLNRILENSCEQCGRLTRLKMELLNNLTEVLQKYPKIAVMDFGAKPLETHLEIPFLIGAEGGFSQKERELLNTQQSFSAPNCNILRSETAALYATSKML